MKLRSEWGKLGGGSLLLLSDDRDGFTKMLCSSFFIDVGRRFEP